MAGSFRRGTERGRFERLRLGCSQGGEDLERSVTVDHRVPKEPEHRDDRKQRDHRKQGDHRKHRKHREHIEQTLLCSSEADERPEQVEHRESGSERLEER